MIYLFAGDNTKTKRVSYDKFIKTVPRAAETFLISKNDFNETQIESLYSGTSLFSSKCAAIFTEVLEREETRDFILKKLKAISASANDFIFLEGKLNKPVLEAFRKAKAEINIFDLPKREDAKFNNFLLANAFADRDKLNLWIYFRQALGHGAEMEALTSILFWKVKDLLLKKNFSRFSEPELKNFAAKLSYLLPAARRRGAETEIVLERFLLEAF